MNTLRQRVEAACDEAEAMARGRMVVLDGGVAADMLAIIRAAVQPESRAAGYQAKARAAAIARGDCTRCLSRRARPGKRTCGSARCRPRPKVGA